MSTIAGQTAGPIGMKFFFVATYGWPWGVIGLKKFKILFFPRATPGPSASLK